MTERTPGEPACKFEQGCHRFVACGPGCAAATVPASTPTDRAAVAARLWALAEHNIVAEWICCEPINPDHDLCVQGDATRRMVRALLVDDPDAYRPAPLLDAVLAEQTAADRAAILQQEADRIRAHCPDHLDSDSQSGSWMVCHCDVADDMLRGLADAASGPGGAAGETQQDERPRCPHCQMPHDLTPDVAAVCASIRASIVDSRAQQAGCGRCGHGQAAHNVSGCTECPGGWRADHRFALADPPCAQHPTAPVIGGMCGGCTQYPADFPKRLPPMDPIHILGIEADEQPAAVSQPRKEARPREERPRCPHGCDTTYCPCLACEAEKPDEEA